MCKNGAILNSSTILKTVASSATEAEYGGLQLVIGQGTSRALRNHRTVQLAGHQSQGQDIHRDKEGNVWFASGRCLGQ